MFRGVTTLSLDAKGRLAIPARYRESLRPGCASQLVITIDKDGCLLLYPEPEWARIEQKLNNLPAFHKTTRILQRLYIGHAHEVEMDGQGRVLIPQELRDFAGLTRNLALVGQVNRFELWDAEEWARRREQWLADVALDSLEGPQDLDSLSL